MVVDRGDAAMRHVVYVGEVAGDHEETAHGRERLAEGSVLGIGCADAVHYEPVAIGTRREWTQSGGPDSVLGLGERQATHGGEGLFPGRSGNGLGSLGADLHFLHIRSPYAE